MIIKLREDSYEFRRSMNSWLGSNIVYKGGDPWNFDYQMIVQGDEVGFQPTLIIDGRKLRGRKLTEFHLRFC